LLRLVDAVNGTSCDAEATIAAFSAVLRDAVDLDSMRADLRAGVKPRSSPFKASSAISQRAASDPPLAPGANIW